MQPDTRLYEKQTLLTQKLPWYVNTTEGLSQLHQQEVPNKGLLDLLLWPAHSLVGYFIFRMNQFLSEGADRFKIHQDVVFGENPNEFLRPLQHYEWHFLFKLLSSFEFYCVNRLQSKKQEKKEETWAGVQQCFEEVTSKCATLSLIIFRLLNIDNQVLKANVLNMDDKIFSVTELLYAVITLHCMNHTLLSDV